MTTNTNDIAQCYHRIHALHREYLRLNARLEWDANRNTERFVQQYLLARECAHGILAYLKTFPPKHQRTAAQTDEFNMLIGTVELLTNTMGQKYKFVLQRQQQKALGAYQMQANLGSKHADPRIMARLLDMAAPRPPPRQQSGGDNKVADCRDKILMLDQMYTNLNKKLAWNVADNERNFIAKYLQARECTRVIMDYMESMGPKEKRSPAQNDEFDMLLAVVDVLLNKLRIKYDFIMQRIDREDTKSRARAFQMQANLGNAADPNIMKLLLPSTSK